MARDCIFRIPVQPDEDGEERYRCLAGEVVLTLAELEEERGCGKCPIPDILAGDRCLYLEPSKRFFNGGESVIILGCGLYDIILPDLTYCSRCVSYTRTNLISG
ncbi:MAG: hypothetical protein PWQ41_103 [Bacillota bacterium]|nr:hypothetical protein [Bacillota bacterium]MDK2924329.1 hypothetical protein [Bacillota bacterium]